VRNQRVTLTSSQSRVRVAQEREPQSFFPFLDGMNVCLVMLAISLGLWATIIWLANLILF